MSSLNYDVVIIGAGVTGTSLFYLLNQFSDVTSSCLIEKNHGVAELNSSSKANSQTLHLGEIESNYSLEKAKKVKLQGNMIRNYALKQTNRDEIIHALPKMLLAVGEKEIDSLHARYAEFKECYPEIEWWDINKIHKFEPLIAQDGNGKKRKEPIAAIGCEKDWCAVNYSKLCESLLNNALVNKPQAHVYFNSNVHRIHKTECGYTIEVIRNGNVLQEIKTKFLVVAAGAYSLLFAHRLGYGKHLSTISVGGSFYFCDFPLKGKVYTMQNPQLPFAAIHGDPDIAVDKTRIGPTAVFMMQLERYRKGTVKDFFELIKFDKGMLKAIWKIFKEPGVRTYLLLNVLYEIPFVREYLFAKSAQKIFPSLTSENITFAQGFGGNRPQVIDRANGNVIMGSVAVAGDRSLFNITPSYGATACLANARDNLSTIAEKLNLTISEDKITEVLDYD